MVRLQEMSVAGFILASAFLHLPRHAEARTGSECVTNDSDFVQRDGVSLFETTLTNHCGRWLSCDLNVLVTDATGVYRGKTMLSLPAQTDDGRSSANSYRLVVGASGGSGQVAYKCE